MRLATYVEKRPHLGLNGTYSTNSLDKSFPVLIGVVEDLDPGLDYFLFCNIKISWLPLGLNGLVPPVVDDELGDVLGHLTMVGGDGGGGGE